MIPPTLITPRLQHPPRQVIVKPRAIHRPVSREVEPVGDCLQPEHLDFGEVPFEADGFHCFERVGFELDEVLVVRDVEASADGHQARERDRVEDAVGGDAQAAGGDGFEGREGEGAEGAEGDLDAA